MMTLLSTWWSAAPGLPAPWLTQLGMSTLWGLVLAWGAVMVALRLWPGLQGRGRWALVLVLAVMVLSWWPSMASPTYWLGLSFQSPSLVLGLVAGYGLWVQMLPGSSQPGPWSTRGLQVTGLCVLGIVLGWVLLLDTLALWPRSVYAAGFNPAALLALALVLVALALWHAGLPVVLLAAVLLLFAVTRLPSGNVWDALSDPLLWVGLHFKLVRDVLAHRRAKITTQNYAVSSSG